MTGRLPGPPIRLAAGKNVGDVVQLENVGGGAGLPAVDGSQLTAHGLPSGFIYGLEPGPNVTSPLIKVDVAVGICRNSDDDGNIELTSILAKDFSRPWAVGDENGGFNEPAVISGSTAISFDNGTSKILGTGLFGTYAAGDKIPIEGSASNDITFKITAAAADELTVSPAPTTESAGASITAYRIIKGQFYAMHMARRSDTGVVDAIFQMSTTPTAPSVEYDGFRRVAWVHTNAVGDLVTFKFRPGGFVEIFDPQLDVDTSSLGTTAIASALASLPPDGVQRARIAAHGSNAGAWEVYISSPDADDEAPSSTLGPLYTLKGGAGATDLRVFEIDTDSAQQLRARSSAAATTLRVAVIGYYDFRNQFG